MASIFGHAISAIGIGKLFPKNLMPPKVFLLGVVSAILPDIDVIGFKFGLIGLDMLGHRGLTHSLFFAAMWGLLLIRIFHHSQKLKEKKKLFLFYFFAMASHGLLDAMTTGGQGVAFFAPFSSERYFLPWRFIRVSPLGIGNFFSEWGIKVIKNELVFIGIPTLILGVIGHLLNKKMYK